MPNPSHHQTNKSQFADDAGQWAVSKNIDLAAEYLQRDLDKLARWCARWRIKLNPEKTKVIIFSKFRSAIRAEPVLSTNLQTMCVRPIFEYGIVSTITVSETVITKIQRVQNSFIRLAVHLPKYVSARLLDEASGLPYMRERLIRVGQNHLARMHANPS